MEFVIDVTIPVHMHVQIADEYRRRIQAGEYADGNFPSRWDIVKETRLPDGSNVAYNTVGRALEILKREGLIVAVPGLGTFVRKDGQ